MPQTGRKREHLERTARDHPEYRDVLSLFQAVLAYVDGKEEATGISFDAPGPDRIARLAEGQSLLSAGDLRVDGPRAAAWLAGAVDVLRDAARDGGEELAAIGRAFRGGDLEPGPLFAACLARDRDTVARAAQRLDVRAALLEFVLGIPLKVALERFSEGVEPAAVEGWSLPHCPACGGRAGMDELVGEEGHRFLCCSGCFFRWPYRRVGCPYCGNEDPETLSYFTAGDGPTRVDVCRKCARYIKTRDSRKGNADIPIEAEDLTTLHLDLLAGREGFERGS